jgi:hypothetical protein
VDVRQDHEAAFHQLTGGEKGFNGVGHQVFGVGVNFQLQPIRAKGFAGEFGCEDGLLGIPHARSIWQQPVSLCIEVVDDIVGFAIGAYTAQGHGDKLRTRGS